MIDNHIANTHLIAYDLAGALFPPTTHPFQNAYHCEVIGCNNSSRVTCVFMTTPKITWLVICETCYVFTIHHIITSWNYADLKQRIMTTRNYKITDTSLHPKVCCRCGVHSLCYTIDGSDTTVCINCYEYAFGHKCRFVNLVLMRVIIINSDVKWIILSTLHRLYMPNYEHIVDQVKQSYDPTQ